ncbi:sugar phosphate nucleotidyltransferase [Schnuerera sp.]|uniref:sugar phosphate nucleotidyltransferase n=1 Tax=Schnuerera sp. TaxID=2794844 RepID=UPI002C3F81DE|nr:sugar phosphate nucleotidyltransferase [Schnuerera sp.]HSH34852.1 sugar phosphate nucleotidyltransferase [Schnuerera sp.]
MYKIRGSFTKYLCMSIDIEGVIAIKGVIMSGGIGTRLRPLTCDLPKPMVPIFNKPVMEYGIELLKKHGINDIAVTLHYLPNMIMDYFGSGFKFDANIKYYIEEKPLGTGGSVKNAEEFLDTTVIVISGDAFTDINLKKAYDFHIKKGSKATLVLKREPIPLEYGLVITDEEGRIIRFLEKPSWGEVFSDTINTGIYILEPEVFQYYKKGENFDFSKDLFPKLLKDNMPIYGYIAEEYWCDVGDLNTYINTHKDILSRDNKHYLLGQNQGEGIWVGEGTIIEKGTKIYPPVYIGKNSIIKAGASLEPYCIIGNNCIVGEDTSIKKSIIWDDVNISNNCEIRKAVLCNDVKIDERNRIFEGAVIGSHSRILKNSTIKPKVKVWPHKTIDENITLNKNMVWEEKASKKLFGSRNIFGVYNTTITPEIAVKLGSSLATVIKRKGTFIVNSDEKNLSKSIKASIISGILSTGSLVIDIEDSTMPMCRFGVRYFKADGGVQIRTDEFNKSNVYIEILNSKGGNIDKGTERKIENSMVIEDYKRCEGYEIENAVNIYNFSSIYLKEGTKRLKNINKIKNKKPKLVIASPSKNIVNLAKKYLTKIGCTVITAEYNNNFGIEDIKNLVLEEDGDLGVFYSGDGEKIALTDGFNIIQDEKFNLLSFLIGFKTGELKEAAVPYNFPRIIEKIAKEHNGSTVYTKSNISDLIRTIVKKNLDFQFVLNFDGIWATGKIIDYLVDKNIVINKLLQEIPEYFYFRKEIPCTWDNKGNVIRRLTEDRKEGVELKEGIRFIDDKGWALIIPDEEKPRFNLYIEGDNEEYAEELWIKYDKKIRNLLKD